MKKTNKRKTMIIIGIIAVCVIALVLGVIFVKRAIDRRIPDDNGMERNVSISAVEYSLSPDEYDRGAGVVFKDGCIKYNYDDGTEGGEISGNCTPDQAFYDALDTIANKYDFAAWSDLPESDIEVLDASTTSLKIGFANGAVICLGDDYEMPDEARKAVSEIIDLLESYTKAGQE